MFRAQLILRKREVESSLRLARESGYLKGWERWTVSGAGSNLLADGIVKTAFPKNGPRPGDMSGTWVGESARLAPVRTWLRSSSNDGVTDVPTPNVRHLMDTDSLGGMPGNAPDNLGATGGAPRPQGMASEAVPGHFPFSAVAVRLVSTACR